ncbi:MAG: transposase, partial [Clostridia bacterium]|nr:transposase [Deltaproteobacteria bacterium]
RVIEQRTRQPCKRGHIFTQVVDRDAIIFSYTERETSDAVKALFKGFKDYVQADAKSVYDAFFRPPDDASAEADTPTEVGCWSHGRRKFWEATVTKDAVAREGLMRIGRMFELEKTWRDKPPAERLRLREKHMTVNLAEFFACADGEHQAGPRPRGLLATALGYVVRQKSALEIFVRDERLVMDNNRSERVLRAVAVGRKAWLFCGSDDHASAAANLMTLIASAKLHGLDPELYLCELTRVLPHWPRERFIELAPKNWARTWSRLNAKQVDADFGWITVPPPEEQPDAG